MQNNADLSSFVTCQKQSCICQKVTALHCATFEKFVRVNYS